VSANPALLGGGEATLSQKAPGDTAGKRKANELDSSNSGGSMEPAARRPAPGPQSGAGSAPLSAQAKGTSAQGPVVQSFASTGEQAANNGRQLSYAEMGAVYAGVMAGRQVKGANAGVDSSATLPTKNGASGEGKGGRDVESSRRTLPETKSPRGEKDVTVGTTAGGHSITHPTALNKPRRPPKLTAKDTGSRSVPVASKEAAQRRTSPGAPGDVSRPMGGMPTSTTPSSAQVEKVVPPGESVTKHRFMFPG
jgi:hypothetical protein